MCSVCQIRRDDKKHFEISSDTDVFCLLMFQFDVTFLEERQCGKRSNVLSFMLKCDTTFLIIKRLRAGLRWKNLTLVFHMISIGNEHQDFGDKVGENYCGMYCRMHLFRVNAPHPQSKTTERGKMRGLQNLVRYQTLGSSLVLHLLHNLSVSCIELCWVLK